MGMHLADKLLFKCEDNLSTELQSEKEWREEAENDDMTGG
jgi:hypothetical protein